MHANTPRRSAAAFSLIEVLIAIALFAVGFVAVAALFPAGALLQRDTTDAVNARHLGNSARAVVEGSPISYRGGYWDEFGDYVTPEERYGTDDGWDSYGSDLYFYHHAHPDEGFDENQWRLLTFPVSGSEVILDELWPREMRGVGGIDELDYDDMRRYYWVPLIRDRRGNAARPNWEIVFFVLKREEGRTYSDATYPDHPDDDHVPGITVVSDIGYSGNVFSLDDDLDLQPGTWVVDNAGGIHQVVESDGSDLIVNQMIENGPDAIYYAPPADGQRRSPAVGAFRAVNPRVR